MIKKFRFSLIILAVIFVLGACSTESNEAEDYPTKDVETIVTWASGGGTDVTARQFLKAAEEDMPESFLVKNVTGGSGLVGWNEAKQAGDDGYTLTVLTADILIHTLNDEKVQTDDFIPLALMSEYPAVIAVDADSEWDTLEDFLETGNERSLKIANDGLGQNDHITALQLEEAADIDKEFNHIPFDGGAEGIAAVLGDNADATISNVPEISSRPDMKVLAIFSTEENEELPDVPLVSDFDMDFNAGSFRMIAAPADTDEEKLDYLEELFEDAYNNPTYLEFAEESNLSPNYMNREESERLLEERLEVMKDIVVE